jgi:hypothetical protein
MEDFFSFPTVPLPMPSLYPFPAAPNELEPATLVFWLPNLLGLASSPWWYSIWCCISCWKGQSAPLLHIFLLPRPITPIMPLLAFLTGTGGRRAPQVFPGPLPLPPAFTMSFPPWV